MQLLEVKPARGDGYHIQAADGKENSMQMYSNSKCEGSLAGKKHLNAGI